MPLVPNTPQLSPEWHAARAGKITGSTAAAILGICPYISRAKAWRLIMGKETIEVNSWMERGTREEPLVRAAYEVATGNLAFETGLWVHPLFEWLAASPDGLIGKDGGVECKRPEKLPIAVPNWHIVQCMVCMICTERDWWDYCAWDGRDTFIDRVPYSPIFAAFLLSRLEEFYKEYIVGHLEPPRMPPRGSQACLGPIAGIVQDMSESVTSKE